MAELDFIYKRHSVRKFKNQEVPTEDIREIMRAAQQAPSGRNSQNYHFIVIKNKNKIEDLAGVIERKNSEIAALIKDEEERKTFVNSLRFQTFIKNAPAVVLAFSGPYPITGMQMLKSIGAPEKDLEDLKRPTPGIQNLGAAMENLMLAAAAFGYGTCWMTGPNYAGKEIAEFLGFSKEDYFLAAITPLGIPEDQEIKSPPRKPLEDVVTIIE